LIPLSRAREECFYLEGLLNCIPWVQVAARIMVVTWMRLLRLAKHSLCYFLILTQISGAFEIPAAQYGNLTLHKKLQVISVVAGDLV